MGVQDERPCTDLIGLDRSVRESEVRSANQVTANRVRESEHGLSHGKMQFL